VTTPNETEVTVGLDYRASVTLDGANCSLPGTYIIQADLINAPFWSASTALQIRAPGVVIGLGDSIAAGYGLSPVSNNNLAYPAQVAARIHDGYDDIAVAGACVDQGDGTSGVGGNCSAFSSLLQQIQTLCPDIMLQNSPCSNKDAFGAPINLITITVGANDIVFDKCLYAAIETGTVGQNTDPCSQSNLTANMNLMVDQLEQALSLLTGPYGFPGVPIALTNYYNPLPTGSAPMCVLAAATTGIAFVNQIGLQNTVEDILFRPDQFLNGIKGVQGSLYSLAASVLRQLNGGINEAAAQFPQAHIVPLDSSFANHDVCAGNNAWLYGPQVNVSANFDFSFVHDTASFSLTPTNCPYQGVLDQPLISPPFSDSEGPFSLSTSGSTNCMVHPTAEGQYQIAKQIAFVLGQEKVLP